MAETGRPGKPEEVARRVPLLARDDVTSANRLNGGRAGI
jgi:NAD(P)-dependent dehydrogenase (short-subunit alcohol dehydrogenase family)